MMAVHMAEGSHRRRRREHQPGWKGLRADLRASRSRFFLRSSADHKRFVFFVIALGTVLRLLRMNGPVSYDEALTYVNFAGRSFGFLFSDYVFTSNHILYSALARASTLVFGVHPWALRLPALVAGVLAMPLFYAFSRAVFNRHIAVIVLCLLAVSGPLVEYSAMARGYSLTWLLMACALLAVRHFVKSENGISLVLLAFSCALGMLATPVMAYPALMAYFWALFMLVASYESTMRRRVLKLAGSFLLFIGLGLLFYSPVLIKHGLDQLLHHPSLVDNTWVHFVDTQQDRAFELWAYFTGTATTLLAFAGTVGVIYSAYASGKYRMLVFSLVISTVPLVLLQRMVAPPAAWTFTLFVLHLGSAIGLFYLLKLIRDKLAPGFSKARRTLVAGVFVLLVFGWCGMRGEGDVVERFPEAKPAAAWIVAHARPGDRVCAELPWDAPVIFHVICDNGDPLMFKDGPTGAGTLYVLVSPGHGQTPQGVLADAEVHSLKGPQFHLAGSWKRLELYSGH